jgi:hypothetical protein
MGLFAGGSGAVHPAAAVTSVPSGNLSATDVQAALNELQADIDTRISSTTINTGIFGSGSDGALSISSGTTTISRDMYYSSITLSGTAQLDPSGYRVYCSGTVSIGSGTVLGIQATNGTVGGSGGGSVSAGTVGGSGSFGGSGGSTTGTASNAATNSLGGTGGTGGTGTSGAGSAAGAATPPSTNAGGTQALNAFWGAMRMSTPTNSFFVGGTGGGGGGGDGTSGAGAGAGAPIVWVCARTITGSGTIRAKGGNGANAAAGNRGGGGGGGGGVIVVVSNNDTTTTSLTFDVSGGSGGSGFGTGTAGTAGSSGNIYRIVL